MGNAAYSRTRSGPRPTVLVLAAVAVALFGVLLVSGPAGAHDHQIPKTVLHKGAEQLQGGREVQESEWSYIMEDGTCYNDKDAYEWGFPQRSIVEAGARLRLRIFKTQRPDSFVFGAHRRVDEAGEPAGRGEGVESSLRRVVRDGKTVAWDAVFSVDRPGRDYYLIGSGRWQDREGCGNEEYAYWGYHVKTRG